MHYNNEKSAFSTTSQWKKNYINGFICNSIFGVKYEHKC